MADLINLMCPVGALADCHHPGFPDDVAKRLQV